ELMEYSPDGGETFVDVTPANIDDDITFYPPAVAAPSAPNVVLFGAQSVWANTCFGKIRDVPGDEPCSLPCWTRRSPDKVTTSRILSIDTVGDSTGAVWIGTTNGSVLFSSDGGATFADRSAGLTGGVVTRVRAVSADGRSAYVTVGGFSGAPSKHVFVTTDE